MAAEVLRLLAPKKGEIVVDATAGQGGHTKMLAKTGAEVLALDADPEAVALAQKNAPKARVINANFASLEQVLHHEKIAKIDKALFDLGWNRGQLTQGKGFSFLQDEPLNMSYAPTPLSGFTAGEVLNSWSEKAIADMLYGYGEERYARKIARAIVARREQKPIETTIELVEIIRDAVPPSYRHGRLHCATRSFQALRIAVNDELMALERGIKAAWKHLECNGRIAVITFHSIEDRVVKRLFADLVKKSEGKLIVKKPLTASRAEVAQNRSARSAKLRVIEKICTP